MTYDNFDKEYDFSLTKNSCKSKGKKKGKDKKKDPYNTKFVRTKISKMNKFKNT